MRQHTRTQAWYLGHEQLGHLCHNIFDNIITERRDFSKNKSLLKADILLLQGIASPIGPFRYTYSGVRLRIIKTPFM